MASSHPAHHRPDDEGSRSAPNILERIYAWTTFFLLSSALVPLLRAGPDAPDTTVDGDSMQQVMWIGVYAAGAVLLAARYRSNLRVARGIKALVALVLLCFLSFIWSASPELTLRRSIALMGATGFALYVAERYTLRQILVMIASALLVAGVLSVAFASLLPAYGYDYYWTDAWRGVFLQKNLLGRAMALGAILWLLWAVRFAQRPAFGLAAAGFCTAVLFMSDSRTALLVVAIVAALVVMLGVLRTNAGAIGLVLLLLGVLLPFAATAGLSLVDEVSARGGSQTLLTGRNELWVLVWEQVLRNPLLGYGYAAFWRGLEGPSSPVIQRLQWFPTHAHNGLIDLWLGVGIVGVVLFCWTFIVNAWRSLGSYVRTENPDAPIYVALLMAFLLFNLTESNLLEYNSLLWVMYVIVSVQLVFTSRRHALERRHGGAQPELPSTAGDGGMER